MKRTLAVVAFVLLLSVQPTLAQIRLGFHLVGGAPVSQNLLTISDITYDGAIRLMGGGVDTVGNFGHVAFRYVSGHLHAFVWGPAPNPGLPTLYEVDLNGITPNTDYHSAPTVSSVVNCGDVFHGKRLSWDQAGNDQSVGDSPTTVQAGTYWNPDTNLLYLGYKIAYTPPNDFTMIGVSFGSDCSTSTAYGAWTVAVTDQFAETLYGTRAHMFGRHPLTGKLLTSGVNKGGNSSVSWGPNVFGGADWPTSSTTGGRLSTPISQPTDYLNYYATSFSVTNRITLAPVPPMYSYQWNMASKGLYYNPEPSANADATRVDPSLNSGVGTWGDYDWLGGFYWLIGAAKQGVLFVASMAVYSNDTTNCSTGLHEWYANAGNLDFGLTSIGHNPTTFVSHEVVESQTSHIRYTINADNYIDSNNIMGVQCETAGCSDPGVGETIVGQTSGETAVLSTVRNDGVCSHGCSATFGATGPSSNYLRPILMIYDQAKLNAIAGGATEYTQTADTMVDLVSQFGIKVATSGGCVGTYAGGDTSGLWIDESVTPKKMYIGARCADDDGAELLHRFTINDSVPAPAVYPVTAEWLSIPLLGVLGLLSVSRKSHHG